MLSSTDFLEKQIIVVSSDEFKQLVLKNDNLAVYEEDKLKNQVSCYKIFCVFVVGDCTITTKLVNKLLEFGISVYFLSYNLKPKFLIGNQLEGNYILRGKQYSLDKEIALSKLIVKNKITNQSELLKSIRGKDEDLKDGISKIQEHIKKIDFIDNLDTLRGIEGNCSKVFFSLYFKDIGWYRRMPRTKIDIVNVLMDIGYTFLYNFIESNLNLYGFDIYKGVYHQLFYERKSLVCDLVEPFRCLIDKQLRKMYNFSQINEKDFKFRKGEYELDWEKRNYYTKLLLEPILEKKETIFNYVKSYYRAVMKDDISLFEMIYF